MQTVQIEDVKIGNDQPLAIIAGPCVAESEDLCLRIGESLKKRCAELGVGFIFKASFDKANRSSIDSPRGPGLDEGLAILDKVKRTLGVPVTTDIHESSQATAIAQVADLLQIPAFLCRQTDLLVAAARTGKTVNVKKGQFMSPQEMQSVIRKLSQACESDPGAELPGVLPAKLPGAGIVLTERGTFFGYQRLVNDFVGLGDLMELGWPVCFDVTHSTQLPGGANATGPRTSGGRPDRAPLLARCAAASAVQALFLETHPNPSEALSDGPLSMASRRMAVRAIPFTSGGTRSIRASASSVH